MSVPWSSVSKGRPMIDAVWCSEESPALVDDSPAPASPLALGLRAVAEAVTSSDRIPLTTVRSDGWRTAIARREMTL